jgi:hypothetical protein
LQELGVLSGWPEASLAAWKSFMVIFDTTFFYKFWSLNICIQIQIKDPDSEADPDTPTAKDPDSLEIQDPGLTNIYLKNVFSRICVDFVRC